MFDLLPSLIGMAMTRTQEPRVREVSDAIRRAMLSSGLSAKELAMEMGLDPSALSRQFNEHGVNLSRLVLGPTIFWEAFLPRLAQLVGCSHLLKFAEEPSAMDALRAEMAALRLEFDQLRAARRTA